MAIAFKGRNHRIQAYLTFIQHKNLEIVYTQMFIICS